MVYVEPDITQEDALEEESTKNDVGVTKAFFAWWKVILESDEEEEGHSVHQRVEDPSVEARAIEEVDMEPTIDVLKEAR